MNYFSSDAFLQSLAQAHFPGRACQPEDYVVDGQVYRLLTVDRRPVTDWPFLDFFEARLPEAPAPVPTKKLAYLPRVVKAILPADGKKPEAIVAGLQASPFIEWAQFPTWEAFEAVAVQRRSRIFSESARHERKMTAEIGPVTFAFHENSDELFDRCVEWKSAQYRASGVDDGFFQDNLKLFQELRRRDALVMSGLRAGEKLLAVCWSARGERGLSYWVPAYDGTYSSLSPGRLLLEKMLRESQRLGHKEFDFLIGDEAYKWLYASHTRVIGAQGQVPLRIRLRKEARTKVKAALSQYPRVLEAARELRKRLQR